MNDFQVYLWDQLTPQQRAAVHQQFGDVAQWRALPRARASSVAVAFNDFQPLVVVAVSHDRVAIDGAIVDIAVVRHTQLLPHGAHAHIVETLMQQALSLLDEGIGIIMVVGAVAEWAPYGFAPVSYHGYITQSDAPPFHVTPQLRMAIPSDAEWSVIQSMALLQARAGVALVDTAYRPQRAWALLDGTDGQLRAAADINTRLLPAHVVTAVASDDGAAYDLLQQLWYGDIITPRPVLAVALPHPLARAALAQYGVAHVQAADATAVLAGVIDLPTMLTALIPAFEKRLRNSVYADWCGGVRIEISDERAMLMIQAGRVHVIDGTREADVRIKHVDVAALAQLAFGYRSVALLRRAGLLSCDDTELPLCDVLFPFCSPVLSLA